MAHVQKVLEATDKSKLLHFIIQIQVRGPRSSLRNGGPTPPKYVDVLAVAVLTQQGCLAAISNKPFFLL